MKWFVWPQYLAEPQHIEGHFEERWILYFTGCTAPPFKKPVPELYALPVLRDGRKQH
jgi:hypothetical protein